MTNKTHQRLMEELRTHYEKQLEQARDLKTILSSIPTTIFSTKDFMAASSFSAGGYTLPDTVPIYVDDLLGGKVIKQEGTKCIVIDKAGSVKTGLTKSAPDKGFNYKLIQE